jgi:hypothetical protein
VEDGLSILQYADDTILLLDDDLEKAKNLKIVLSAFEKLSGLKINFHKSELFSFGETKDRSSEYVELFGCKEGSLPFKYLGIPMSPCKLSNKDWRGWRKDLRISYAVGRASCSRQGGDWS